MKARILLAMNDDSSKQRLPGIENVEVPWLL